MIIEVRAKNCFAFEDEIKFSMKADMRNKKFISNVHIENNFNVLKTIGVYGPNNVGKTCLIKCIKGIKEVLLDHKPRLISNLFTDNDLCELGITFLMEGRKFSYDFKYDSVSKEYPYEKFIEIYKDRYGNETVDVWFFKDIENKEFFCKDDSVEVMIPWMAQKKIFCYLIDAAKFVHLAEMQRILEAFALKIDIINMDNIPMEKTINLMKNKNDIKTKVVDFVKNADLYLENFEYVEMEDIIIDEKNADEQPNERALQIRESLMERVRLVSTYKGVSVPSILFDSTGTKKIAALASYIIEGLEEGRILIVDELDSSIHFKITRAIVAMFNNELNKNAQLIFTVHDINLMDCKKLFRKEQIWFIHKDIEGVYIYSLADFTAQQGVRDTTDIIEKYRKGALGALPDPNLINSLLDINKGNSGGADVYE